MLILDIDTAKVLVIANFDKTEQEIVLSFPKDVIQAFGLTDSQIVMNELLRGDKIDMNFSEQKITFTLPAYEASILKF